MEAVYRGRGYGLLGICRREMGLSQPRTFARQISASEGIVKQIDLYGKLNGHEGFVNTVEFNSTGDLLVSGSDDRQVMIWNWAMKGLKLSYHSGHLEEILHTRIMPFTDDRKIVTCSADGQVRLGLVMEHGKVETKTIGRHQGSVHNLAVEPGSPDILFSCGEDGFVQRYDLRSNSATKLFCCSSFTENEQKCLSPIKLYSIVIDPRNPNYFAVGGTDKYARVYDIRKYQWGVSTNLGRPVNTFYPRPGIPDPDVQITGLAYSNTSELLVSYNDDLIYLFQKNMGMGPDPSSASSEDLQEDPQVYLGHRNAKMVKRVSFFGPNDEFVMSGSDCWHIFIWKKKGGELVRLMVDDEDIASTLEPHPHMPVLATCGLENNVKLWAPMSNDVLPLPQDVDEIMESNRQDREHHLSTRQALTDSEEDDVESEEELDEDEAAYIIGLSYYYHFGEGSTGNSADCNIN
ncbi:uncharacterized protein LOC132269518 [Cornus florida]|uniref:uncharacterized protein LOC132269518 n=1 Tax=Cornus florida TaxID=4283 RepID=UPI0028A10756|nr:uncharacterized protein LOC132269518 [Cornus florida]